MNSLSKEKQTQLIMVAVGTLAVIAAIWFLLVGAQENKIKEISRTSLDVQADHDKMHKLITSSSDLNSALITAKTNLDAIEASMPSGDLFSWIVTSLKKFNASSYKVDMPQIGPPAIGQVHLFPDFPYSQAVVTVSGSAYYYDLGKFLRDLENEFPYLRVQNISLEPGLGANPDEREKLFFRMEIVNLVKSQVATTH
jgi:hypothetical protein